MNKSRIYKYDNVKALLIFLVVIGHMTTDYVSDSHMVRWITLWIYSFHMPAFIFISGLMHKQYITEERAALGVKGETHLRWDKVTGFFLCAYGLKVFLQLTRTLMGQHPLWHWIAEPGIPWYLFVMAEYELLFYIMRYIDGGKAAKGDESNIGGGARDIAAPDGMSDIAAPDGGSRIETASKAGARRPAVMILAAFALSAAVGYFPAINDTFCLSRMINFLPIYMIGYYLDMKKLLPFLRGEGYGGGHSVLAGIKEEAASGTASVTRASGRTERKAVSESAGTGHFNSAEIGHANGNQPAARRRTAIVIFSWATIIVTMAVCCLGKWGMYSWRKWFTGRRSYEFLQDYFSYAVKDGWWIRIAVWAVALCITFAIVALMPDRNLGFITTIGSRTLSVYFWHRPICYLFRNWMVLPRLYMLLGGSYDVSVAGQVKGLAFQGSDARMILPLLIYCLIGAAMTAILSLKVFEHPTSDLMKLGARIAKRT